MEPFFFGASTQTLYGVYHHPNNHVGRDEAILICPTYGQEYMRAHRANRQLAGTLAKQGFHVLRFDYRGTGDSSGEIEEITIKDWLEDIVTAIEELKETSRTKTVHIIGLRLGALLSASVTMNKKLNIKKIVLWDPIISGESYDQELQAELNSIDTPNSKPIDKNSTLHFHGFPLSKEMREDLSALDLCEIKPQAKKIMHIVSKESHNSNKLKAAWSDIPTYQYSFVKAPGDWNFVDDAGGIMLPQPILHAITAWMIS
ncbi:MAG: esterase/lipase [Oleiphilaceae bacterium]|jgi:esterase/lipase